MSVIVENGVRRIFAYYLGQSSIAADDLEANGVGVIKRNGNYLGEITNLCAQIKVGDHLIVEIGVVDHKTVGVDDLVGGVDVLIGAVGDDLVSAVNTNEYFVDVYVVRVDLHEQAVFVLLLPVFQVVFQLVPLKAQLLYVGLVILDQSLVIDDLGG